MSATMSENSETIPLLRQRRPTEEPEEPSSLATTPKDDAKVSSQPEFPWSNPLTWPASLQLAPIAAILVTVFSAIYWNHYTSQPSYNTVSPKKCRDTFHFTFHVQATLDQARRLPSHSWEYGIGAEAMLELLDPLRTVFASEPFPADKIPALRAQKPKGIEWVQRHIRTNGEPTLYIDTWGVSDSASLGVPAIMLGQSDVQYLQSAMRQKDYLIKQAPRYSNGAISHRTEVAELWSDAISMFPPFLALYGVVSNDLEYIREAFEQCRLYREVLRVASGPKQGLWKHIVGPSEMADEGVWSTGAAWAAHGMARVRATISGWRPSNSSMTSEIALLDEWIGEILDGAIRTDDDDSLLLRNYLGDSEWFGETSGTALLAATAYRMAVLNPTTFSQPRYLHWAHQKRRAVLERVDKDGLASPTVNPLKHGSREPIRESPEGASFLLMLGAAWRDCVCSEVCV